MYKNKIMQNIDQKGNVINTIINTLHEKNQREEMHSKRVSEYCVKLATAMGYADNDISKIKIAGMLHDIGKIALEEGILNKQTVLTEIEREDIKRHPEIGYRIIGSSYEMIDIAEYTLSHHERWDGKGYPKGLAGTEIPKISRIIGIADAYDAMTSERTYKKVLNRDEAILEIEKNRGTQFDPEIAKIFIEKVLKVG
jgi:putative nucleotidyltransferase with HDIG domain